MMTRFFSGRAALWLTVTITLLLTPAIVEISAEEYAHLDVDILNRSRGGNQMGTVIPNALCDTAQGNASCVGAPFGKVCATCSVAGFPSSTPGGGNFDQGAVNVIKCGSNRLGACAANVCSTGANPPILGACVNGRNPPVAQP